MSNPLLIFAAGAQELEHTWTWFPLVVCMLAVSFMLYTIGLVRSRRHRRVHILRNWQAASFFLGWALLAGALVSPMHKVGSALFSVHMTQHELLMLVIAPLIVIGRPLIALVWALPERWRDPVGRATKRPLVAAAWAIITAPIFVWLAHAVALWMWHVPALYDAALNSELIHAAQHAMFLGTAVLFWWTLVNGRYGRMGYGMAVLYVFTTGLHTGILGALFTLTDRVWFGIHEGRTAAFHMSALEDQQLAGLIMWIPAGVVFVVVALALFTAWLGEAERRVGYSLWMSTKAEETGGSPSLRN
jgi:putative membrane protein